MTRDTTHGGPRKAGTWKAATWKAATWKALAAGIALAALPGCKQAEDLDMRREAAERQLGMLEQMRATRDAQLQELKLLQIEDARLSQQLSPPTQEALAQAFAALPGVRLVPETDGSTVVTGRAPLEAFGERLLALGQAQPGVVVRFLRVDGDAVEARLVVEQPEEAPTAPRPSPIGQVLPWNRDRLARLREVEARITAVRAELPQALQDRPALQWRVGTLHAAAAHAAETRTQSLAVARALASGAEPLMTELDVQPRERGLHVTGRVRAGIGQPELARALSPGFVVDRMEPVAGAVRLELSPAPAAGNGGAR